MRKKWFFGFMLLCMTILALCACHENKRSNNPDELLISSAFVDSAVAENEWKDNSLDAYRARFNLLMNPAPLSEGYTYGGWNLVLGKTKAYVLQKHLYAEDYRKAWDELIMADENGKSQSIRLSLPFTPDNNNQIMRMGQVWDSDHLVCVNLETEGNENRWRVFELDENLTPVWDYVINFLSGEGDPFPQNVLCDSNGYVHLDFSFNVNETTVLRHYVTDKSGRLEDSYALEITAENETCLYDWFFTAEGDLLLKRFVSNSRTAMEEVYSGTSSQGLGQMIACRQVVSANPMEISYVLHGTEPARLGNKAVTYADQNGVCRGDVNFKNNSMLYAWENHGISVQAIEKVNLCDNGDIMVFYYDQDGGHYAALTKTTEKVEQQEITLVTLDYRVEIFKPIIAEFQRTHPAYRINLKTNYVKERLLSELGTGSGPVLVDTYLTGFESNKNLWELLDEPLGTDGTKKELIDGVLDACSIDGKLYGVPIDFEINTACVSKTTRLQAREWTYIKFIELAGEGAYKAIFPPSYGNSSKRILIRTYLMHGLEDNYLINSDDPSHCIDEEKLKKVLFIAEELCRDENTEHDWNEAFRQGELLCCHEIIKNVSKITINRLEYGENLSYVGLPTSDGGKSYIVGIWPLAIRKTASNDEKRIAMEFLKEVMSYDGQKAASKGNINFGISIRKDVLEEQIQDSMESYVHLTEIEKGKEQANLMREKMSKDAEVFRTIISEAVPEKWMPQEVTDILEEEFGEYFCGNCTREQLLNHLQSRVGLYLSENIP